MHIYKSKVRYNQNTGKPDRNFLEKSGDVICDYTGEVIAGHDEPLWYTISINYNHSSEPMWYEEELRDELEDNYGVEYGDFSAFMESPYHFKLNGDYTDVSLDMLKEWMNSYQQAMNGKHVGNLLYECRNIEEVFRTVRLRTLKKLLDESTFTVTDLGFLK
jgi:hypothetical protein